MAELGIHLDGPELDEAFRRFKETADRKKEVTTADLEALVGEEIREREDVYSLDHFYVSAGSAHHLVGAGGAAQAGRPACRQSLLGRVGGIGLPGHRRSVGVSGKLMDYQVRSITSGKDSLGEVRVVVEVDGKRYAGQAVSIGTCSRLRPRQRTHARGRDAGGARGDRVLPVRSERPGGFAPGAIVTE